MIIKCYFMRNGTILTLHIIPSRKLHKISFQMAYNVAMCTMGTLNPSNNAFFWSLAARLFCKHARACINLSFSYSHSMGFGRVLF